MDGSQRPVFRLAPKEILSQPGLSPKPWASLLPLGGIPERNLAESMCARHAPAHSCPFCAVPASLQPPPGRPGLREQSRVPVGPAAREGRLHHLQDPGGLRWGLRWQREGGGRVGWLWAR